MAAGPSSAGLPPGASQAVAVGSSLEQRKRIGGKRPLRQRDWQAANEALRAPVEFGLAAELRLDAGDHASGSEPARHRLLDRRPAGFHPYDLEKTRMVFP